MVHRHPMRILFVLAVIATATAFAHAGNPTGAAVIAPTAKSRSAPPEKLPDDLVEYFSGKWSGEGEFASGRKIAADLEFHADLEGQWLAYRHVDRPPGTYKAAGMWGHASPSNAFVMTLNDSFGGARTFSSSGWRDGNIVFERDVETPAQPATRKRERFTFLRQGDDEMKMSYETTTDGSAWKLVDHLVFRRN